MNRSRGVLAVVSGAVVLAVLAMFALGCKRERTSDAGDHGDRGNVTSVRRQPAGDDASTGRSRADRRDATTAPQPMEVLVNVVARRFEWRFSYPGGPQNQRALVAPEGANVVLTLSSEDVLHALFIPALRLRAEVLPARYSRASFIAPKPGRYPIACAEYCGSGCGQMRTTLIVKTRRDYRAWRRTTK